MVKFTLQCDAAIYCSKCHEQYRVGEARITPIGYEIDVSPHRCKNMKGDVQ